MASATSEDIQLRAAAAAVLAGQRARHGEFVALTLDLIERGAQSALATPRSAGTSFERLTLEEAVGSFLEHKFTSEPFLRAIADATESAVGLVVRAAANYTLDLLRRRAGLTLVASDREREPASADHTVEESQADSDADPGDDGDDDGGLVEPLRAAMSALCIEDRVLVRVLVAPEAVSADELAHLARASNLSEGEVRARLNERAGCQESERGDVLDQLEQRRLELNRLQIRTQRLARVIAEVDPTPAHPDAQSTLPTALHDEPRWRSATPGARSAALVHLHRRMAMVAKRIQAHEDELKGALVGRPDYQEVALLTGEVRADAGSAAIKTAANTVQVRATRIFKRIGKLLEKREPSDGS